MENKGGEQVATNLRTALEQIESSWMHHAEYQRQVAAGGLADYEKLVYGLGDRKFEQLHPSHPLADKNRTSRMGAADYIRDTAAKRLKPFPETIRKTIGELMFDCSGAVRHSLATAMYHAGNHRSMQRLQELAQMEQNSAMVRDTAAVAALRCWQRGVDCKRVPLEQPSVSIVSADVNLAIELDRLSKKMGFRLLFPEPVTSDLFVFPASVRIVNRRALGQTAWRYYLDFLEERNRPLGEDEKLILLKDDITDEDLSMTLEPPLILTDGFSQVEAENWGLLPEVGMEVYRAEEWMNDWILAKVNEILENSKMART